MNCKECGDRIPAFALRDLRKPLKITITGLWSEI
jgi:hypothetical protein